MLMPWWRHRSAPAWLLDIRSLAGLRIADLAIADIAGRGVSSAPFWFRVRIDLQSRRVIGMRMISPGHFMFQRYYAFGSPERVLPPA